MAQWVSADFSKIVPDEVDTILTSAESILNTASGLLSVANAPLLVAKNFLIGLPLTDLAAAIRSLIEQFKSDILGMGFYTCPMWDYVLQQAEGTYGPDGSYGSKVFQGGSFKGTFLQDLINSFDDRKDPNRPTFQGDVSMLVLVAASPHIDSIGIGSLDQGIERIFPAISSSTGKVAKELAKVRWQTAWSKMLSAAESSYKNVAGRVERVQRAYSDFCRMDEDYISRILEPLDPATGNKFFENMALLDWETYVVPILESVEECVVSPAYPNWKRAALIDVYPEIVDCVDLVFDPILAVLPATSSIVDAIVDMIESIEAKIQALDDLIAAINKFLEDIENLKSLTGLYAVMVSSSTGVSGLKTELANATGYPTGDNFYSGMALLVGGPQTTVFQTIFGAIV